MENVNKGIVKKEEKETVVGEYILKQTIGTGAFSKVKLAIHQPTKTIVAVKILDKTKLKPEDRKRTEREIQILISLNHPNVIQVNEVLSNNNNFYIVMEYCPDGELFHYIVRKKRLSNEESAFLFFQIINGIEYIHKKHISHRDLKPENILLLPNRMIKIIDFGLSNFYNDTDYLTTPCGSPCYAAPEMLKNKSAYSGGCVDIWSAGIILFAMLCGYLPFQDKVNVRLFQKILNSPVNYPNYIKPNAKNMISKLLIKDPTKRITIPEIKNHPFYMEGENIYNIKFNTTYDDFNLFKNKIDNFNRYAKKNQTAQPTLSDDEEEEECEAGEDTEERDEHNNEGGVDCEVGNLTESNINEESSINKTDLIVTKNDKINIEEGLKENIDGNTNVNVNISNINSEINASSCKKTGNSDSDNKNRSNLMNINVNNNIEEENSTIVNNTNVNAFINENSVIKNVKKHDSLSKNIKNISLNNTITNTINVGNISNLKTCFGIGGISNMGINISNSPNNKYHNHNLTNTILNTYKSNTHNVNSRMHSLHTEKKANISVNVNNNINNMVNRNSAFANINRRSLNINELKEIHGNINKKLESSNLNNLISNSPNMTNSPCGVVLPSSAEKDRNSRIVKVEKFGLDKFEKIKPQIYHKTPKNKIKNNKFINIEDMDKLAKTIENDDNFIKVQKREPTIPKSRNISKPKEKNVSVKIPFNLNKYTFINNYYHYETLNTANNNNCQGSPIQYSSHTHNVKSSNHKGVYNMFKKNVTLKRQKQLSLIEGNKNPNLTVANGFLTGKNAIYNNYNNNVNVHLNGDMTMMAFQTINTSLGKGPCVDMNASLGGDLTSKKSPAHRKYIKPSTNYSVNIGKIYNSSAKRKYHQSIDQDSIMEKFYKKYNLRMNLVGAGNNVANQISNQRNDLNNIGNINNITNAQSTLQSNIDRNIQNIQNMNNMSLAGRSTVITRADNKNGIPIYIKTTTKGNRILNMKRLNMGNYNKRTMMNKLGTSHVYSNSINNTLSNLVGSDRKSNPTVKKLPLKVSSISKTNNFFEQGELSQRGEESNNKPGHNKTISAKIKPNISTEKKNATLCLNNKMSELSKTLISLKEKINKYKMIGERFKENKKGVKK